MWCLTFSSEWLQLLYLWEAQCLLLISSSPPYFPLFVPLFLQEGELSPPLGRRGSSPPCSALSILVRAYPQPFRGVCRSGAWVTLPSVLSTSAGTHDGRLTQDGDKEGIRRWLLQVLLHSSSTCHALKGVAGGGAGCGWRGVGKMSLHSPGPPTLASGGSLLLGASILQGHR